MNLALSQNVASDEAYRALIDWLKIVVPTVLGFGLGIIGLIAYKRWEMNDIRPQIEIQNVVVTKRFHLKDRDDEPVAFWGNRIRVINKGKTGAKDCKVYVELSENNIERTAWMLPDSTTPYSLTLNVDIPEYVDLCAIEACGRRTRVVTNEHGYRNRTIKSCRPFDKPDRHVIIVRVASSNAKPAERRLILRTAQIGDPKNPGRIVEFED